MTKFIFTTMVQSQTIYTAGSGKNYSIAKGAAFTVTDDVDIAFFDKNVRFRRVGIVEQAVNKIVPSTDSPVDVVDDFKKKLSSLEGISSLTVTKIVEYFADEEAFKSQFFDDTVGNDFSELNIPEKQVEIIKEYYNKLVGDE